MKFEIGSTVRIISETINGQKVPESFKIGQVIEYDSNSKLYHVSNDESRGGVVCDEIDLELIEEPSRKMHPFNYLGKILNRMEYLNK